MFELRGVERLPAGGGDDGGYFVLPDVGLGIEVDGAVSARRGAGLAAGRTDCAIDGIERRIGHAVREIGGAGGGEAVVELVRTLGRTGCGAGSAERAGGVDETRAHGDSDLVVARVAGDIDDLGQGESGD